MSKEGFQDASVPAGKQTGEEPGKEDGAESCDNVISQSSKSKRNIVLWF